jgi:hypothetical protein
MYQNKVSTGRIETRRLGNDVVGLMAVHATRPIPDIVDVVLVSPCSCGLRSCDIVTVLIDESLFEGSLYDHVIVDISRRIVAWDLVPRLKNFRGLQTWLSGIPPMPPAWAELLGSSDVIPFGVN